MRYPTLEIMESVLEPIHTAIYTTSSSRKRDFANDLLQGRVPDALAFLKGKKGGYFSDARLAAFLEAEARYEHSGMGDSGEQALKTRSTGERKKALLNFLLKQDPDFIVLDDPFDNLDRAFQDELRERLLALSGSVTLIQLVNRAADVLPCMQAFARLDGDVLMDFPNSKLNYPLAITHWLSCATSVFNFQEK